MHSGWLEHEPLGASPMTMTISRLAGAGLAALAATLISAAALAGPAADKAAALEAAAAANDSAATIAAYDRAAESLWAALPFAARVAVFTEGGDNAYGRQTPKADSAFHAGETANIYIEPVGYGFIADGETMRVSLKSGIEIRTPEGLILGRTDDLATLDWSGRSRSYEVPATLSLTLPQLKAGNYLMDVTLTDAASGRKLTVTLPFSIAAQ
jgi:hypothetical protein